MNDHKNSPDTPQYVNEGPNDNYSFPGSANEDNNAGCPSANENQYSDEYDSYTPWE